MEDSKKKLIMAWIIVLCLVLAGVITFATFPRRTGGIESIKRGEMIWVKCMNPECEAEYQMGLRDYFEYLKAHPPTPEQFRARMADPNMKFLIPLVCKDCEEESVNPAVKCEKCGIVFLRGSVPSDFADRCPECSYSKTESLRKEAGKRK
ncbi:MAG: hypothetical protein ACYS0C_07660 [Planctomycetota bacterium]|jgi:hypothetical protein